MKRKLNEMSLDRNRHLRSTPDSNRLWNDPETDQAYCHLVGLTPGWANPTFTLFSHEMSLAIALAVQHLNEGIGSLVPAIQELDQTCPKLRFATSMASTEWNPSEAFALVDELTENVLEENEFHTVCGITGATSSAVSKTTGLVTSLRGIPQVSHASTNEDLNDKADYPFFARTVPDDNFLAEAFVKFLYQTLGVRHLFVVAESDPFPKSVLKSLRNAIVKLGWSPISGGINGTKVNEESSIGDITNFLYVEERIVENIDDDDNPDSQGLLFEALDGLRSSDVRFVLALTTGPESNDRLMKAAYSMGLANGQHYWWFYETLNLKAIKVASNSSLSEAYDGVGYIYQTSEREGDRYARFVQESTDLKTNLYREINQGSTNTSIGDHPLQSSTFSITDLFASGYLNKTDWLQDGYAMEKPLYAYDATILLGLSACREARMQSANATTTLSLNGKDFFQRLLDTNFTGVSGNVVLDPSTGTRDGHSVQYAIDNWKATEDTDGMISFEATTPYILRPEGGETWEMTDFPYRFAGNQTLQDLLPNPDLPPVQIQERVSEPWIRWVALGLMAIILVTSFGFAVWTCRHWNGRVVRASQPHFLFLICLGFAIAALAILPISLEHWGVHQPDSVCNSMWWLMILGYGIAFSTLFAKTYRINRIVSNSIRCRRVQLSIRDTLFPVAIIFCFNVVMLSFMTALAPLTYETTYTEFDKFSRPIEEYGNCQYDKALPFLLPTVGVNLFVVCLALFQAWRARHLSTEFAESRYIANALSISVLMGLFAIPILISTQGNPNVDTFVNTIINVVVTGSSLCCIFVPKIIFRGKYKQLELVLDTTHPSMVRTISAIGPLTIRTTSDENAQSVAPGPVPATETREKTEKTDAARDDTARISLQHQQQHRKKEVGERILTIKTQEQLALENRSLRKENKALQRRLKEFTGEGTVFFSVESSNREVSHKQSVGFSLKQPVGLDDDCSIDSDASYEFYSASMSASAGHGAQGSVSGRHQLQKRMSFLRLPKMDRKTDAKR